MRVLLICVFIFVVSGYAIEEVSDIVDKKCANDASCVDAKLQEAIERIDKAEALPLIGGLEIVKIVNKDADATQRKMDEGWWDKLERYMSTHELQISEKDQSSDEEGRTKKLKKFLLPLLVILKLKLALILPAILSALTLISIKGVFSGLIAILLSSMTAFKSFGEGKQDRITAIVAPIPTDVLRHHDYRWSRSGQEANATQVASAQNLGVQSLNYAPETGVDPYNPYAAYQSLNQINPAI